MKSVSLIHLLFFKSFKRNYKTTDLNCNAHDFSLNNEISVENL